MTSSLSHLSSNPEELFELPELVREDPNQITRQIRNENNMVCFTNYREYALNKTKSLTKTSRTPILQTFGIS